ncbi:Hypothetical protein, putative [Bodo saltans]|uniref:Uncharacterized protein n=1 Tax=Bodo saltans TaxID=75058 RepID=A0A0S4JG64_BODSA|nr:Hypothetical protein, putative [Bodo saltans]|eukprot:CUG88423.1 Hypothetical protein, putative [Bodo saltans]
MPPNPPPYHPNNNNNATAGGGSHTVSPKHHTAAARASPSSLLGVGASGLPPLPPSVGGSATLSTVSSSSLLGSGHYNNRRRSNSTSASLASEGLHRDLSGSSLSGSGLSGVPMQQHPHLQLVPPSTATPMSMHSPAVSIGGMGTMGMGGGPLMTAIPSAQSVPLSLQSLTLGGGVGGGNGGGESSSADTFIPARSKRRLTSELDEPPSASNLLSVQQTALGKRTSLSSTTSSSHNSQRLSISVGQPLLDAPGHGSSVSLRSSALSDIPDPSVGSLSQQLSAGGAGASWFALQNDRRGSSLSISSPTSTNAAAGRVAVGFFETPGDEPSSAASAAAFRQHRVPSHSGAVTDSVYLENANRPRVSPTSGNRGGGAVGRGFNFPQLGIGAPAAQVGPPQVTQLYHLLQGGSGGAVGNVSNSTQQHQQHQQFPQSSLQSQSSSVSSPSFMGGTQNFTPSSVNHWAPNGSGSVSTRGNHNVMAPSAGGGVGGGSGGVDLVLGHVGDSGSHTPQQHQQQHGIRGGGAAAASGSHQPSPAAHRNASHNHNNTNTNTTTASSNPVREFEGENSYSEVPLMQMSGIARRQREAYSSPIGGPAGGPNFLASGSGQEDLSGVVEGGIDGVMPSAPDIALQLHLSHASLSSVASRGGFGNTYTNNLTRQMSGANHSNSNTNYNPNGSMRIHNAPPALLHNIPASINASGVVIVSNPQGGVTEYHQGAPEIQGHRADGGARPMNRWPGRSFSIGVDGASPYSGTPPHRMNSTRSQQSFVLEPNAPGWLHSSRGSIAELNDSLATPSLASGRHDASSTTNAAAVYLSELAAAVASGAAAPTQQPLDRPHMQIVRNLHRVAPQAEDDGSMVTIHGKTLVFGPAAADEDDDDDVSGGAVRLLDGSGSVVDDAEVRSFSSATGLDGATTAAPPAAVQRPPGTDQGGGQ